MKRTEIRPPTEAPARRTLSLPEIAATMGVSREFLRLEVGRGRLRAKRFGKRLLVLAEDLDEYLAAAPTAATLRP